MQCDNLHRSVQMFVHLYSLNIKEIKDIEGQVSIKIKKEI